MSCDTSPSSESTTTTWHTLPSTVSLGAPVLLRLSSAELVVLAINALECLEPHVADAVFQLAESVPPYQERAISKRLAVAAVAWHMCARRTRVDHVRELTQRRFTPRISEADRLAALASAIEVDGDDIIVGMKYLHSTGVLPTPEPVRSRVYVFQ